MYPASDPSDIVMVIDGPTAPADIDGLCECLRRELEARPIERILCDVGALIDPDLATVDALARLQLTARRLGYGIRLLGACGELLELLALCGLDEVVSLPEALPLEPRGQAKQREPSPRVEEEGDPGDPVS